MKKVMMIISLLIILLLVGCTSDINSLTDEQQNAVKNSIEYINNSPILTERNINMNIVEIQNATEDYWDIIQTEDNLIIDETEIDVTDWIITIGDTREHHVAVIVCDSDTQEVIGQIPLK